MTLNMDANLLTGFEYGIAFGIFCGLGIAAIVARIFGEEPEIRGEGRKETEPRVYQEPRYRD